VGTSKHNADIGDYTYDTAGNRVHNKALANQQTIVMGLKNRPTHIQQSDNDPEVFFYAPSCARYLRVHADGRKTFYVGEIEHRLWSLEEPHLHHSVAHIRAKGYSPDIQTDFTQIDALQHTYIIKDHLGSPVRTISGSSTEQDTVRFDPWGQRSQATGVAQDLSNAAHIEKTRGYTGHETIASANMHHMNGRIHDAQIGLFTGPDPFLKAHSIVAQNRYCYVSNSPFRATDPTGWIEEDLFHVIGNRESTPQRRFIYANYAIADTPPVGKGHLSLGYAKKPGMGVRRTQTTLPGHTHLMMETMKWDHRAFAHAFKKGKLGKFIGGGFVESENFVHIHPINSFKSAGQLEDAAIAELDLADAIWHHGHDVTMNPLVPAKRADRSFGAVHAGAHLVPTAQMPKSYMQDFLRAISLKAGKPLWLEEYLISDFFPWTGEHNLAEVTRDFEWIHDYLEPVIDEIDRELNLRPPLPNRTFPAISRFQSLNLRR